MAQTNKAKYTVIKCTGEAHSNAFIDNCSLCAPNWGVIVLPPQFKSLGRVPRVLSGGVY
jgi:hypothetical protein